MATKDKLDEARDLVFTARYLVEGILRGVEDLNDERRWMIQTLANVAIEKLDAAIGSAILDPPPTSKQVARARASIEKAGGFVTHDRAQPPQEPAQRAKLQGEIEKPG